MADEKNPITIDKQEVKTSEESERIRDRRIFTPLTDIYEQDDAVHIIADMPGADEKSIDISLEKNVLTITGMVDPDLPEDYTLIYSEYGIGDYQRKFILSNEIDQDKIKASFKDGVLHLHLLKSKAVKPQKIIVKAE